MPHANCGIYRIRRVDKSECYIGQSVNVYSRWKEHLKRLRAGNHRCRRMQSVFAKHGQSIFVFEILCIGLNPKDKDAITLCEQEFMDAARVVCDLYNTAPAAGSIAGVKWSHEDKAKASVAQKLRFENPAAREASSKSQKKRFENPVEREKCGRGRRGKTSPQKGKPRTAEQKAAQSAKMKGRPSPHKGKKHSAEYGAAISERMKGRPSPQKGKPRTAEQSAAQSAKMKGRPSPLKGIPLSREHKVKLSRSLATSEKAAKANAKKRGVPRSDETKLKLRIAAKADWERRKASQKKE